MPNYLTVVFIFLSGKEWIKYYMLKMQFSGLLNGCGANLDNLVNFKQSNTIFGIEWIVEYIRQFKNLLNEYRNIYSLE